MIDYYKILGLDQSATTAEIKTAFRTLAKLYHPDKNENGKEFFTTLLKAYETLCNKQARSRYDLKFNYYKNYTNNHSAEQLTKTTKTWRFDEKELKRRQYYNQHFKKQMQDTESITEVEINKTRYNEFKYIFYSIPLAVILFLLIVKFTQSNSRIEVDKQHNFIRNK